MPKLVDNSVSYGVKSRIVAKGMLRQFTPLEDYYREYGLLVKREDLACPPPGPPFSKTRGVYAHILNRPEKVIGVLDTAHSQAGHAVARACEVLGKECINFYPVYKAEGTLQHHVVREPQMKALNLGARLVGLHAGRSCILYHAAKRHTVGVGGYMMPNALKLDESVEETAKEAELLRPQSVVVIPASSGTIAAGVVRGLGYDCRYIVHLGYKRSHEEVRRYIQQASGVQADITIIDEGYAYKDVAKPGPTPPWPCNPYYDLKAFRWWIREGREALKRGSYGEPASDALFWNIG